LRSRLVERGSSLATSEALDPGLELQARSILDETVAAIRDRRSSPVVAVEYGHDPALAAHGRMSATRDRDPAEPLMAAEVLFDVALAPLAAAFGDEADPLDVARQLHHAIWRRFPRGAIAYVEALRVRLRDGETDARLALSRELHDSVANPIAAAIQRVELAGGEDGGQHLVDAREILRDVLESTRALASRLRSPVPASLHEALSGLTGGDPAVRFQSSGVERPMPESVHVEAVSIANEAIRNSRRHAVDATAVDVTLEWAETELRLSVRDDGRAARAAGERAGLGVQGMRERAARIDAQLDVVEDGGFLVMLRVPYAGE
jgi:signal transduction histidine kinase